MPVLLRSALTFLCLISIVYAQSITGEIRGQDDRSVDLVNIALQQLSGRERSAISDSTGHFRLAYFGVGRYKFSFSKIGYQTFDTFLVISGNLNLIIMLHKNFSELNAVIVKGKRAMIERKIDRIVFNVNNNINSSGLDALDVLARAPMLTVRNDAIAIVGKDNVGILIDGRLQYASGEALKEILRAIPGESIESIEVITNPPARYDASGNSGLVNIITKKIRTAGYYGSLNSYLAYATDFTAREGLSLNCNVKKFELFGTFMLSKGANPMTQAEQIYYPGKTWQQATRVAEYYKVGQVTAGFEVPLNARTSFGVSYNWLNSHPDVRNDGKIDLYSQQLDSFLISNAYSSKTFIDESANLHYSHRFDSAGTRIDIDADCYSNIFNTNTELETENYYSDGQPMPDSTIRQQSVIDRHASIYTVNASFDLPLGGSNLNYGVRVSIIRNNNGIKMANMENDKYITDSLNTNQFNAHENIRAAFLDFDRRLNKHFQIKTGVRAECTNIYVAHPDSVKIKYSRYFSLFPDLFIKYLPDEVNVFILSYGRRINRPTFANLDPFRLYLNSFRYVEGNPTLTPYYSNNFEFAYSRDGTLYASLGFDYKTKGVGNLTILNDTSIVQYSQPANFLTQNDITFTIGGTIKLWKTIESQNEASLYHTVVRSNSAATLEYISGLGGNLKSSNTITVDRQKTLSFGIDYNWKSSEIQGISQSKGYNFLDVTGRKLMMGSRLKLTLGVRDVFRSKNIRWSQTFGGITTNNFSNNNSRRLIFTARYSFGNNRIRKGNAHTAGGDEQALIR